MEIITGTAQCNGADVFYRMVQGASQPPLVCVHGAGGDSRLFVHQLREIGRERTVVAVDLPGHGESGSTGPLSVELYRDAVLAVADKLSFGPAVFGGHSMGGGVLFEIYRAAPERVAGLVFISTAPELPVNDMILDYIEKDFNGFCAMVVDLTYSPDAADDLKALAVEEVRSKGPETVKSDFTICKNYRYNELVRKIDVPFLLLSNRKDKMVPLSAMESFHSMAPGSKLRVYEARGHLPYLEGASEVNRDIAGFIESLP